MKLYFAKDGNWGNGDGLILLELTEEEWQGISNQVYEASDMDATYEWVQDNIVKENTNTS